MKKNSVIFLLILLLLGIYISFDEIVNRKESMDKFKPHRVAHAGGGINNKTYTNSYEALNSNLKKGFKYFEIDFSFTEDNELVCLHDWENSFKRYAGGSVGEKVTLEEFKALTGSKSKYIKCTLGGLSVWLNKNTSAYIVTDVKENNIKALQKIVETIANAKVRIIPQIYNPKNYPKVKSLGFEQIVWTLYRTPYSVTNREIVNFVKTFEGAVAVTMPQKRAKSKLAKELKKINVPTYVHTINSPEKVREYQTIYGVTEIYTDFLNP